MYWISKLAFSLILRTLFRMEVTGREHEPRRGPFIAVSNHWSAFDPPVLGCALRHKVHFMAKEELFRVPILSSWMWSVGTFPVRRGEADRAAIRAALNVVRRGEVLGMFPEGTRNPSGYLLPAEPGAAFLALRAGVPILPVGIIGTLDVLPKGAKVPRLRKIRVRIGPPVRVDDIPAGRDQIDRVSDRIMHAIAELLGVEPPVHVREEVGSR
jgi:1-acyl-sn-glycerol-3-phosphate acyltransferase